MEFMPQLTVSIGLRNCTVTPDEIKKEFGPVTAIVWGELFRFSQMYDAECKASLDTLAEYSGLSKRSVINHLQVLCDNGYAVDLTPDLRNKPHTYRLTSKVKIKIDTSDLKYLMISGSHPLEEDDRQSSEELWNG